MSGRKNEHISIDGTENSNRLEVENLLLSQRSTMTTVTATQNNTKNAVIFQGNRDNWSNRIVYLLSIIGFVVDLGTFEEEFDFIDMRDFDSFFYLGNVWRFPTTCYRNGGGAFLIPYFTFLFLVGLPCKSFQLTFSKDLHVAFVSSSKVCTWN